VGNVLWAYIKSNVESRNNLERMLKKGKCTGLAPEIISLAKNNVI
jgi:hypothetical protein